MKRTIFLTLALTMALAVTGCGSNGNTSQQDASGSGSDTTSQKWYVSYCFSFSMGLDRLSAFIIAGIFKKSMPGPLFPRAEDHPHQDQYPGGSQAAQQDHCRLRQGTQVGRTGGGGAGLV